MKKIPTVFCRNRDGDKLVRDEITPGCEWVFVDEDVRATRKHDGTCCLIQGGKLFRRHEVKIGRCKPEAFVEIDRDETTGKCFGWLPVGDGPEDKWHREARIPLQNGTRKPLGCYEPDGTYELCGPKVQGNPERFHVHVLCPHGKWELDAPKTFDGLRDYLAKEDMEGIVWWHPDGRMAKLKVRDFGLTRFKKPWPPEEGKA